MKVADLKSALARRGLDENGLKKELAQRLRDALSSEAPAKSATGRRAGGQGGRRRAAEGEDGEWEEDDEDDEVEEEEEEEEVVGNHQARTVTPVRQRQLGNSNLVLTAWILPLLSVYIVS